MANMGTFVWFTVVVVGILVSSLAMISMGAACWDNCKTVPLVAQYLVFTGSIFFCILILLLLLTFCICTSSGDPKIDGALKIVYGVSVVVMFILLLVGTTILFVQSSADYQACNNTNMANVEIYKKIFNSTASPPQEDSFCSSTLQVFSYSVLLIFHVLLFFSLLVTFYDRSK